MWSINGCFHSHVYGIAKFRAGLPGTNGQFVDTGARQLAVKALGKLQGKGLGGRIGIHEGRRHGAIHAGQKNHGVNLE